MRKPTFLSTLPYQWASFLFKGAAFWWLVLNFRTRHPHRVAFNDGFQSSPHWLQYQALWKETFPTCNCRYPIPRLEERTFEKSWSHSHQFITEGNQNPRQEQEILSPQVRLMARNPPLKPDQHVLRCYSRSWKTESSSINTPENNMEVYTQGSHGHEIPEKVMELEKLFSRPGNGPKKCWTLCKIRSLYY